MKTYKGMRVFPPKEHRQLTKIVHGWTAAAEEHGFQQYRTPIIDPAEIYENKTSEEIMQEQTYRFLDRGGRDVVLRPEITPGASSMIAEIQHTLRVPFKAFSIGSVFRYERTQRGRSREHIQYNVDIFGESSAWADAEVIEVAFDALKKMGFQYTDFEVRLNDRAFMEEQLRAGGVPQEQLPALFHILDRRDKMSEQEFHTQVSAITPQPLENILTDQSTSKRVTQVLSLLPKEIAARPDPHVIRGFDYYTGIVFEIFSLHDAATKRSVAGGGRYDTLIESYGGTKMPAVGFGMGDVRIIDCLDTHQTNTEDTVTPTIVSAANEDVADFAYTACRAMRTDNEPISFIGITPKKKLTAAYQSYEDEGCHFFISVNEDRTFSIRNLRTRETYSATTANEAVNHLNKHHI